MDTNPTPTETELNLKLRRIYALLDQYSLDALLLHRTNNFSWVTCGTSSYINTADSFGNASLLITPTNHYVLTNNIEFPHLTQEEELVKQGWEFQTSLWYDGKDKISELTKGMKLGADTAFPDALDLSHEIAQLRFNLTKEEGERFRTLGMLCAQGIQQAVHAVRPGMTEYEAAGLLSQAVESKGVQAIVNLIAFDDRIFSFRHPLPTSRQLEHYAMLVLCGRKWGLICSVTRFIHFGPIPDGLRHKAETVAQIDSAMIAATRPGDTMREVFRKTQAAYASAGFPDEWQLHHQGGLAGYEPREIIVVPMSMQQIMVDQAYAWNPSITGAKSEDTILVGEGSNEIITEMNDWPAIEIQIGDQMIKRPAILEIK
jgi:Xaa-Pro aminopeptidase